MTRLEKCELLKKKGYSYNPETGQIFNIRGNEIKTKDAYGYNILMKGLKGHHFAWYMIYGNVDFEMLDHINGVRNDNSISNLRVTNNIKNHQNRKTSKGYTWDKGMNKWRAQIQVHGKHIYLGCFDNKELAHQSYIKAKQKYSINGL